MIDRALRQLVKDFANVGPRVQPASESVVVTKDLPRVVYGLANGGANDITDDGPAGITTDVYQLDIFATTETDAMTVYRAIRAGLHGFSGVSDSTVIQLISIDQLRSHAGEKVAGANNTVARVICEVTIAYRT